MLTIWIPYKLEVSIYARNLLRKPQIAQNLVNGSKLKTILLTLDRISININSTNYRSHTLTNYNTGYFIHLQALLVRSFMIPGNLQEL